MAPTSDPDAFLLILFTLLVLLVLVLRWQVRRLRWVQQRDRKTLREEWARTRHLLDLIDDLRRQLAAAEYAESEPFRVYPLLDDAAGRFEVCGRGLLRRREKAVAVTTSREAAEAAVRLLSGAAEAAQLSSTVAVVAGRVVEGMLLVAERSERS